MRTTLTRLIAALAIAMGVVAGAAVPAVAAPSRVDSSASVPADSTTTTESDSTTTTEPDSTPTTAPAPTRSRPGTQARDWWF